MFLQLYYFRSAEGEMARAEREEPLHNLCPDSFLIFRKQSTTKFLIVERVHYEAILIHCRKEAHQDALIPRREPFSEIY